MRYICVAPSTEGWKVLIVRERGEWSLPHVVCNAGWIADAVADLQTQMHDRYGAEVVVLRCLHWTDSTVACELELLSYRTPPELESRWLEADDIEPLLRGEEAEALAAWAEDRGWERRIAPWQRRGWFSETRQWIEKRVGAIESLTQVKAAWNGSCVLRVASSDETLYFKAAPQRRPGEPAVIRKLSATWSAHLPSIVTADEERCWSLMHDIGGRDTNSRAPAELADAARLMADIQIDQAPEADAWLALGCPDRSLDVMRASLERLLIEIPSRLSRAGVLEEALCARIASIRPLADQLCQALSHFAIPGRSIHHEDFRDGNVQRTAGGGLVLIDWNDTAVAHPFFTLQRFLWFMPPPGGVPRHDITDRSDDVCRRAIRDAYLEEFEHFETPARLLEAFRISSQLSPVYDALRFASSPDVDEVLERGLAAEERRIARHLMEHVLEVFGVEH